MLLCKWCNKTDSILSLSRSMPPAFSGSSNPWSMTSLSSPGPKLPKLGSLSDLPLRVSNPSKHLPDICVDGKDLEVAGKRRSSGPLWKVHLHSCLYLWVGFIFLGVILEATFHNDASAGRGRDCRPVALRHCCPLPELCDASCLPPFPASCPPPVCIGMFMSEILGASLQVILLGTATWVPMIHQVLSTPYPLNLCKIIKFKVLFPFYIRKSQSQKF